MKINDIPKLRHFTDLYMNIFTDFEICTRLTNNL